MKTKQALFSVSCLFALLLCHAPLLHAASTISVSGAGDGVFLLQGNGVDSVAALDITITYDLASLGNPRVVLGELVSGAMSAINPNTPGTVRMAIIRTNPIRGSGIIATLTFDRKGDSPGKVNALNARLTDINGANLPVVVQIVNPSASPESSVQTAQNQATTPAETPVSPPAGASRSAAIPQIPGGMILSPQQTPGESRAVSDATPPAEQKERPAATVPLVESSKETAVNKQAAPQPVTSSASMTVQPKTEKTIYTQKSVLDRFYLYKGENSAKKLTALFEQDGMIGFRQEPPVVLSDGNTIVRITFIASASSRNAPEVSLKGATLLSVKKDPNNTNTWVVSARPDTGEYAASLTVPQKNITMIYPIAVSPQVDVDLNRSGTVTEDDFTLFLKERGTDEKPKFDLNNDGKRNAVDDYVFTANYLVEKDKPQTRKQKGRSSKPSPANKRRVN